MFANLKRALNEATYSMTTIGIGEVAAYVVFMSLLFGVIMNYPVVHVLQLITIWPLIAFGLALVETFVGVQFEGYSLLARSPMLVAGVALLGLVSYSWWHFLGIFA